jgi:hypothetical protein
MTIVFSPSDVSTIRSEIYRLDAEISGVDDQIQFAHDQLDGTDAEYLYTADEIRNKSYLRTEQQLLFPAQTGVIQRDNAYKNLLYSTYAAINSYESEGKLLHGAYPIWNSTSAYIVILKNSVLGVSGNVSITNTLNEPKWLIYGMADGTPTRNARGAILAAKEGLIVSHTTITISDGIHAASVFEFIRAGEIVTPGNIAVTIVATWGEAAVAAELRDRINAAPNLDVDANTAAFDFFEESVVQTSGAGRVAPLFNPTVDAVNPENPGQMFGGTVGYSPVEPDYLSTELTKIAYLATGYCQVQVPPPPPHIPALCQTARLDLVTCLTARYNPATTLGILKTQEIAIAANPDLLLFPINPLTKVQAEIIRITTFLNNLASIPVTDPIPPVILTANLTAATNRQTYLNNTRIPEIDTYLNTTPGYYTVRYEMLKFRVSGSGTLQEVNFWQGQIVYLNRQKQDLLTQKATLEALLPV